MFFKLALFMLQSNIATFFCLFKDEKGQRGDENTHTHTHTQMNNKAEKNSVLEISSYGLNFMLKHKAE